MFSTLLAAFAAALSVASSVTGSVVDVRAARTPGKLRVTENSGVCETTQGVYQASGYGDIDENNSIWLVYLDLLPKMDHVLMTCVQTGFGSSKRAIILTTHLSPCGLMVK